MYGWSWTDGLPFFCHRCACFRPGAEVHVNVDVGCWMLDWLGLTGLGAYCMRLEVVSLRDCDDR
jgi:hypothetical protein